MDLKRITDQAQKWVLLNGPSLLLGIAVLIAGLWLIRVISKQMSKSMHRKDVDPSLKPFLLSLAITALRVLLILGVMQIIGIQMSIFAALIAALGVAAGLALSGTLQNFASGVIILILKPFSVGDNIIAQDQEGTVTSIQIFYTIVTTFDNRTVIFPNSKLSNEVIINISRIGSRRLDIELKFSFAIDYEDVKKSIDETVRLSKHVLKVPEARVGISAIEPDGYKVMLNLWLHSHGFVDAKMEIQRQLVDSLKKSELKLPGL